MSGLKYKHLFEPVKIGRTLFKNRIFASPQDHPDLTCDLQLTREARAFYEVKAMGGYASVCVGDFMVEKEGHSHPWQLDGDGNFGKATMTRTARGITRHGAVAAIELNHAGINSSYVYPEGYVWGLVDGMRPDGIEIRAMDDERIEELIKKFAQAAAYARQCGFGMITVHAGHGWCLSQFLSPRDNVRKDRWGGSFENRMRFPLAVIEAVKKATAGALPIEVRISGAEWLPDGYDIDEGVRIAKAFDGKVDLIHVSVGHHEIDAASMRTHPTMFLEDGCNVEFARRVKACVSAPVATVGALTDVGQMEEIIASGKADIVCLGRQTLADPDLPIKARCGREDEINKCMRCFTCFSNSTLGGVFYCATNPKIGNELDVLYDTPPVKRKKVLIAGGGIGGMQAAITAAERGHEVILCEKTDSLGGVLQCEKNIPFKKKLEEYIALQRRKISRMAIDVRLDTEVTPAVAEEISPDVIIAAMGSVPVKPKIPGIEGENVYGANEIYYDFDKAGKNTLILGGGLVGLELGVALAMEDRNVTVVEMLPATIASEKSGDTSERMGEAGMAAGEPLVQGVALCELIKTMPNMRILTSAKALEISETGVRAEIKGKEDFIPCDTVIYAVGQRPREGEALALYDCAPEFYQIGDCSVPKNIMEATQQAYFIARDIGRY